MKLLIKQRVFSWSDTYDVYDENMEPKYFVKAEFFTIGHKIHVYDRMENEIGMIQERVLTFMPKFEIFVDGEMAGMIVKRFSVLKPKYEIDYKGWEVQGDFFGWDYEVTEGNRSVMWIEKQIFRWGDTYVLEFDDPQDEITGLMLVIAIDAANCSSGN